MNAYVEVRGADVIDLRALMQLFWQWRRWIGVSVAICVALFLFLAFTMTPIYRSTVVMAPTSA
ncbi:MAG: Wzz/FepE/Etk N-terminal domain-containing protein, partial [Steroidobacteraceae bacterium]